MWLRSAYYVLPLCAGLQFDVALLDGITLDMKGTEDLGISCQVCCVASSLVVDVNVIAGFHLANKWKLVRMCSLLHVSHTANTDFYFYPTTPLLFCFVVHRVKLTGS